jgi:hypothetical protein
MLRFKKDREKAEEKKTGLKVLYLQPLPFSLNPFN